jgi:hypothetical protein
MVTKQQESVSEEVILNGHYKSIKNKKAKELVKHWTAEVLMAGEMIKSVESKELRLKLLGGRLCFFTDIPEGAMAETIVHTSDNIKIADDKLLMFVDLKPFFNRAESQITQMRVSPNIVSFVNELIGLVEDPLEEYASQIREWATTYIISRALLSMVRMNDMTVLGWDERANCPHFKSNV